MFRIISRVLSARAKQVELKYIRHYERLNPNILNIQGTINGKRQEPRCFNTRLNPLTTQSPDLTRQREEGRAPKGIERQISTPEEIRDLIDCL